MTSACIPRFLVALGSVFLCKAGAIKAEDPHHFSAGLKHLAELAMPEMKGAEWIAHKGDGQHPELIRLQYLQNAEISLKGNVWKLDTNPPSYLGFAGSEPFELGNSDASGANAGDKDSEPSLGDKIRAYARKNAQPDEQPAQKLEPKPRTLAQRDASRIAKALRKPSYAQNINERMQWGGDDGTLGYILLYATQLLQAGEEDAANEIAEALFEVIDDDTAVINMAIHHLAEAEYQQITQDFFADGDWDAYLQGLKGLLRKYTRGWSNRAAVDLLAARVAKRKPPEVPTSIEGIEIQAEARTLVQQLLQKPQARDPEDLIREYALEYGMDPDEISSDQRAMLTRAIQMGGAGMHHSSSAWLLEEIEAGADKPAIEQLKALGMDALPALAAMVDDDTLTQQPRQEMGYHYGYVRSSRGMDLQQAYDQLTRPSSRGELISGLLVAVLPIQSDPYQAVDHNPGMLRDLALDLYREHKDSSKTDLALHFFRNGSNQIQSQAAMHLIQSEEPAVRQSFESAMLEHHDPLEMISYVENHLNTHKAEAKTFARAFIKKLKDAKIDKEALQMSSMGYQIMNVGGIDKYCDQLALKVGDISLDKLIKQALQEKPTGKDETDEDEQSAIMALGANIQEMSLGESMDLFAGYADKAEPRQWSEIISLLLNHVQHQAMMKAQAEYERANGGTPEPLPKASPLTPEQLQAWGKLRQRDTPLPKSNEMFGYMRMIGCETIGDVTTILIDFASGGIDMNRIFEVAMISPDGSSVIRRSNSRIEAMLKGETPEAWPDADSVKPERRDEILAKLAELPAAEIPDYASSLDMDERLVAMEYSTIQEMGQELPGNIIELNQTLVDTKPMLDPLHDPAFIRKLDIQAGQKIDEAFLLRLVEHLLENSGTLAPSTIVINRGIMNMGSTIQAITPTLEQKGESNWSRYVDHARMIFEYDEPDYDSLVLINIGQHRLLYILKDGKPELTQSRMFSGNGEADLKQALEGEYTFAGPIVLGLVSRDQADGNH